MKVRLSAACAALISPLLALCLGPNVPVYGQVTDSRIQVVPRTYTLAEVRARIDKALAAPGLKNAVVGVLVRSAEDGRTLYERNADFALVPASNMKLLTATTALAKLGTDFRYTTTLLYKGNIDKGGTLNGDLFIRGSGDPTLSSERLLSMADDLRKAGIKRINGRIVADATAFDDHLLGSGWGWDDEPYYYSAQIAGLNCDENTVPIEVHPGDSVGDPVKVTIGGEHATTLGFNGTTYFTLTSTATTGPEAPVGTTAKPALDFARTRASNNLLVSGTIPRLAAPVTDYITVEDPALYTATRLSEVISTYDIRLPAPKDRRIEKGTTPPDAVVVSESKSAAFNDVLKHFLKESDNLYGEAVLKTVGGGTVAGGVTAVRDMLKTAGIPDDGLYMVDGSGLSRKDTVTPRLLVNLLIYITKQLDPAHSGALETALPVGGVDGTLRSRFKGASEGQIQAKTGSLARVSSLSGFVRTKRGERLAFSILMNNYSGNTSVAREAQDAIVLALMDAPSSRP